MENNSNGNKTVDLPDLDIIPRGKWLNLIASILALPTGKALAVPRMSLNDQCAIRAAFIYRKELGKKLHTRNVGEETYFWLSKADRK